MNKAYMAAAKTYSSSRGLLALVVVLLLFAVLSLPGGSISAWPMIPILLSWSFVAFSFTWLTKEQFCTPQARLTPRFRSYHLIVAGAGGVLLCVITALLLSAVTGAQFFATCAVLAMMLAFNAWGTWQPAIYLVFAAVVYTFCCTQRMDLAVAVLRGQVPAASVILLLLAVCWLGLFGWKLSHVTEEDRAYSRRFYTPSLRWGSAELSPDQQKAISRSRFVRAKERRLEEILTRPAQGLWGNARRLREASGFAPPALIAAVVLAASWAMSGLLMPGQPLSPQMAPVALLGILMSWRCASRSLSQEAMRPVTRRELLQQFGLILMVDVLKFWATVTVLTGLAWAIMSPQLLADGRTWRGLGFALCGIPLFVGVGGLAVRIRSNLGFWSATIIVYAVAMGATAAIIKDLSSSFDALKAFWAGGLLMLGASVCYGTYRAWLRADLE